MTGPTRRVQVLPEQLATKIAAGEVIQRPDSVVKELLENALDAGATSIFVRIEEGGKRLIQIVDDGWGMDEEDAVHSFLRHATSKIASYDDLEGVMTYGFRGEALASVAAVAMVTMKTRKSDADEAVVVQIDGGSSPRISRAGREPGTSITVQNLFFNVPARRKFLKSTNTEFRHIYDSVQRTALSHPDVGMKFVSDDEVILDLKPAPLTERVLDLFGDRQSEGMVWMEEKGDVLTLSGFVGKPAFGRKTRADQFLFLNKRFIVNRNINHAIYSAYEHLMTKGTFPFFLLYLDIDPHRVDVNVHPSKMEAKFEDEQMIYRFVSTAIRKCLSVNELVPSLSLSTGEENAAGLQFTNRQHQWGTEQRTGGWPAMSVDRTTGEILSARSPGTFERTQPAVSGSDVAAQLFGGTTQQERPVEFVAAAGAGIGVPADLTLQSSRLVWQIHNKYIIAQIENGVMIVDQHVAHERILYEQVLGRFARNASASQQLMFPVTLKVTPADYSLLSGMIREFELVGFSLKPFGKDAIVIDGVPPEVKVGAEGKILEELLQQYREYQEQGISDQKDALAKSFACKAAIKAGDRLTDPEMRSLLDQLFSTAMPYVCPHGRPVVLKIATDELDRRFGRT
jgi:DNA mismatch repair protein MutL